MLILTRRADEAIKIGADIYVKVLEVRNGQVRVGLTAPQDTPIVRTELLSEQKMKK